jgi:membrane protein insertase Oxa1/YidC/SpoIIIJ
MPCSKSVYCYRIIFTKQEAQRRSAENVRNMDNKITDIKKKYKKMEKGGVTDNEEDRRIKGNYRRWRV